MVRTFCSICGTRHEREMDPIVFTANRTYLWLFVIQIFGNGKPSRGGDHTTFEVMMYT
jgi:hypothetical protein